MILKLVNPLELLEDRIVIHIWTVFYILFLFSEAAQHPSLRVPGGRVYLGL